MPPQPPLTYEVRFEPNRHELKVSLRLTGPLAQGTIPLSIPTWVPGDYSFAPQARDLFNLTARCERTGKALVVRRDGWQGFLVDGGCEDVRITYTAYAWGADLAESAGYLGEGNALILGARFLFHPAYTGPYRVHYIRPEGWSVHHPSGALQVDESSWDYPSYEILLDTPVAFGKFARFSRDVLGTRFWFVFVDRAVGFEEEVQDYVDRVAAICASFHTIFGSFPFSDYTFYFSCSPDNDWGLEHLTSTMCGLGPDVFTSPDDKATGVRVAAHELFHAWNVRTCRPAPLGVLAAHLTDGAFTDGLWLAEGFTRYYEFLSSTRIGIYTVEQFVSNVVGYYSHLVATPAYQRVSGADSSLSSFLNHQTYPGRVNNGIDYYDKGMLIAFALDTVLRTEATGSLDASFAKFYHAFKGYGPGHPGYTTRQAIDFFASEYAPLGPLIGDAVEQPGGLTTPKHLEALGFTMEWSEVPWFGLVFQDDVTPAIYGVVDDSAAGAAGLAPGDQLSTVNGFAFSPKALSWAATHSQTTTLGVLRGHQVLSFTLKATPHRRIDRVVWNGTPAQAELIRQWLNPTGRPLVPGFAVDLGFYQNFHGIAVFI